MSTQEFIADVESVATRIIYELLGRRWIWPAITTTEEIEIQPGQNFVCLDGRPVINIASVTSDIDSSVELEYTLKNGYRIELGSNFAPSGPYWNVFPYTPPCSTPRRIIIEYTYGSPPPPAVALAIDMLIEQFTLLLNGSDDCKLPERVKSVTRQGISMDILSPQDFLDKGRTGITEIDEVISVFNSSRARRPARVVSPVYPPPRRHGTTQADA